MKQIFPEASWHKINSIYVREACLSHAFVEAVIDLAWTCAGKSWPSIHSAVLL